MLAQKTLQIGQHTYRLTQVPGSVGRKLALRLTKALLPIFARMPSALTAEGCPPEAFTRFLSEGIADIPDDLVDQLSGAFGNASELVTLDASGRETFLGLSPAVFDQHFAGNYAEMFDWLVESVKFNQLVGFLGLEKTVGQ